MIRINGENVDKDGQSISRILADMNVNLLHVAVEVNQHIVNKSNYETTVLHDGDQVEIVRFVGGG